MSFRTPPIAALLLLAAVTACSGGGPASHFNPAPSVGESRKHPQETLGGIGGLSIMLCDAAPRIGNINPTAIDLAVDSVGVVSNGQAYTIAQYSSPVIVNVLQQQNGNSAQIGIGQYFSGAYQAVQFTFDMSQSQVVAGSATYPIAFLQNNVAVSSAGAGGSTTTSVNWNSKTVTVTVAGNFQVGGSPAPSIQADFNALESLAQNANGQIVSRPTLFAAAFSQIGKVDGVVTNSSGGPVAGGTYQIAVYNSYKTATGQTVTATGNSNTAQTVNGTSVTVNAQQTTRAPVIQD